MLKSLNKNDTLNTPFMTALDWHLSNVINDDLILYEHTGSDGGELAVAIEFIDYADGSEHPFFNSSCSLANERQTFNKILYREGRKINGLFYPTSDPINLDNTYKRLVYQQIKQLFYNNYRDPTKMWGIEEIDFDKSQAKKFLQERFVLFDVPQLVMGEKIVPYSVKMIDNSSDNEYIITDDGHCNLFIGTNVFSKQQEIRPFGNVFSSGSTPYCDSYFNFDPPNGAINLTASQVDMLQSAQLDWYYSETDADGFMFDRSMDSGSTWPYSFTVVGGTTRQTFDNTVTYGNMYWYRTKAYNLYGTSSWSNTASVFINSLLIVRNPQDTAGEISSSVSFSVAAYGATPIYYQWQSGSTILSDTYRITGSYTSSVFTSSLIINELHLTDTGSYRAFVWNAYQGLTSSYAWLRVILHPPTVSAPVSVSVDLNEDVPLIISHPADQYTYVGGTASFSVSASGTPPLYYYWQSGSTWMTDSFAHWTGSQSQSFTVLAVSASDTGSYRVLVSNDGGYVYSNYARLIINEGELITTPGVPYRMGPYDTFEDYPPGTSPTNGGYGWDGAWELRPIGNPDYQIVVAIDSFDDYAAATSIIGLNSGSGWLGNWKSSSV